VAGDAFTVSLAPRSGTGSVFDNPNTYFDNFDFNSGTELSATPFTSVSGTVTITASAIPEPASIISGLTALLIVAGFHGVRRLRRHSGHGRLDRARTRKKILGKSLNPI